MSENVVRFAPKEPKRFIWRCDCGSLTHLAHENGAIECAACSNIANGSTGSWRTDLPDMGDTEPAPIERGDQKVIDLGSEEMVIKRIVKRFDPTTATAILVINRDGSMSVWNEDFDTSKRLAWLDRKMREAKKLMRNGVKR